MFEAREICLSTRKYERQRARSGEPLRVRGSALHRFPLSQSFREDTGLIADANSREMTRRPSDLIAVRSKKNNEDEGFVMVTHLVLAALVADVLAD